MDGNLMTKNGRRGSASAVLALATGRGSRLLRPSRGVFVRRALRAGNADVGLRRLIVGYRTALLLRRRRGRTARNTNVGLLGLVVRNRPAFAIRRALSVARCKAHR